MATRSQQLPAGAAPAKPTPTVPSRTASSELARLLQPAIKAWLLGYAFDYIPAILKLLLRFVIRQSRALAEAAKRAKEQQQQQQQQQQSSEKKSITNGTARYERKATTKNRSPLAAFQPAFKATPQLLFDCAKAALPPLGPSGTAALSFVAMAAYAFSDSFFWWPIIRRFVLSSGSFPHPGSQAAIDKLARARVAATFISASLSTALSITYLQLFNPTLDLTLFAFVRGLDTFVRASPLVFNALFASSPEALAQKALNSASTDGIRSAPRGATLKWIADKFGAQADGLVFVVCCAQIMWAWFYYPQRLPPTYSKWISNLAWMDVRLFNTLKSHRSGEPHKWTYGGEEEKQQKAIEVCTALTEELKLPARWGNTARAPQNAAEARKMLNAVRAENRRKAREAGRNPASLSQAELDDGYIYAGAGGPRGRGEMGGLPCEIVHCGVAGESCLANAALRWWNGWKMSMRIYVPVHLLPKVLLAPRRALDDPKTLIKTVAIGSARSASFLATFITSIWFAVCFSRTLVLARLFPNVSHNFWDGGFGPLLGCWLCGFSIFLEEKKKRAEMALYVAPRALFALAESLRPGWLSKGGKSAKWTERVIFGLSLGVVISAARHRPDLLRGITGILGVVVRPSSAKRRQQLAAAI
ncbi:hypothetical protein OC861_004049 [Tilletia horrida]|nr:hypothetical protein OC861_004049 [Tilletia horrida]